MMAPRDQVSDIDVARSVERAGLRRRKVPILALAGSCATRNHWSMFGMALGYLGLVAILSMAPFLQQTITRHHGQPMLCTDFGGSR